MMVLYMQDGIQYLEWYKVSTIGCYEVFHVQSGFILKITTIEVVDWHHIYTCIYSYNILIYLPKI